MAWTATFDPDHKLIHVHVSNTVTAADLRDSTTKAVALSKEFSSTKFLVDAREFNFVATLFDIVELPSEQYVREGVDRLSRVAVLSPDKTSKEFDAVRFYETACRNRGWDVMIFTELPSALHWLNG